MKKKNRITLIVFIKQERKIKLGRSKKNKINKFKKKNLRYDNVTSILQNRTVAT